MAVCPPRATASDTRQPWVVRPQPRAATSDTRQSWVVRPQVQDIVSCSVCAAAWPPGLRASRSRRRCPPDDNESWGSWSAVVDIVDEEVDEQICAGVPPTKAPSRSSSSTSPIGPAWLRVVPQGSHRPCCRPGRLGHGAAFGAQRSRGYGLRPFVVPVPRGAVVTREVFAAEEDANVSLEEAKLFFRDDRR